MKRSDINKYVIRCIDLLEQNSFKLPQFGYWKLDQWLENKDKLANIKKIMLGWDVTDFGSGSFDTTGAVLITIRNGVLDQPGEGTPYAEKLIFLKHETEQQIPFHYHAMKTEDIINRGGGILALELFNSTPDDKLDQDSDVVVKMDGIFHTFKAGSIVEVERGCSITLEPKLFHRFWAKKDCGDLIIGEISSVNDDRTDNIMLTAGTRYAQIEEDEAVLYPLCNEIGKL